MVKIFKFIISIFIGLFLLQMIVSADDNYYNINISLTGSNIQNFDNQYREYMVDYLGRKYDGIEIEGQIRYSLRDKLTFKANSSNQLKINISGGNIPLKKVKTVIQYRNENNGLDKKFEFKESYQESENKYDFTKSINNSNNIFTSIGKYRINIEVIDYENNISNLTAIYQVDFSETIRGNIELKNKDIGEAYGDNNDYYEYIATIIDNYGNILKNKNIIDINHNIEGFSNGQQIRTDIRDNNSPLALRIFEKSSSTNNEGQVSFKLKSLAPGFFTQRFKIEIEGNKEAILTNYRNNYFDKPFWGELKASNNDGINWNYQPNIDEEIKYKIKVNNINIFNGLSHNIVFSLDDINTINPLTSINSTLINERKFKAIIEKNDSESNTNHAGLSIGEEESKVLISYILSGVNITYKLSQKENYYSNAPLFITNDPTDNTQLNVKIIGQSGESIDSEFQNEIVNISRNQIRQKAYQFINQVESGQIIGGIKFINGDYNISGEISEYETLVITNGNLIISNDLNLNNKKLGIIVLQDGYNIENGYSGKGNIIIGDNVSQINAVIYSDGAMIGNNISNQLHIKGSLLTRNTIGGAKVDIGLHDLPGGAQTTDYDLARKYDLNYLRIGNNNCIEKGLDDDGEEICKYEEHLIIEYNSSIISNPPKLFY